MTHLHVGFTPIGWRLFLHPGLRAEGVVPRDERERQRNEELTRIAELVARNGTITCPELDREFDWSRSYRRYVVETALRRGVLVWNGATIGSKHAKVYAAGAG